MEKQVSGLLTALIAARNAVHLKVHKAGKNSAQGYKFVGHEHVLEHSRKALLDNGLILEQVAVEYLGAESYKTRSGENVAWRWRGSHKLAHVGGEERVYVFEATTGPNDKAAFVASTALDRTAILRIMQLAGSDEENPEHDSNEQDKPAPRPQRTLDDVAAAKPSGGLYVEKSGGAGLPSDEVDPALAEVLECGVKWDGSAPQMPRGTAPIYPDGTKYAGKPMDTVPVGYLRATYKSIQQPGNRAWAEYLIKAHAYTKMNGGM